MRVLQINVIYPNGSTGKIINSIDEELTKNGHEAYVIYGRGPKTSRGHIRLTSLFYCHLQKLFSRITGLLYGGCFFSTNRIIRLTKTINPDIVHLHCLNGNFVNIYRLIRWLKKNDYKVLLSLHAEFMHTGNCGHALDCDKWKTGCGKCPRLKRETQTLLFDRTAKSWSLMKNAFDGLTDNLIITSVSPWLMKRAEVSPILNGKNHCVVMNGLDEEIFHHRDSSDLKIKYGLSNKKIIFHATPSFNDDPNDIKGGVELIRLAKEFEKDDDVVFVVAGPNYCKCDLPKNILSLGKVSDQNELAELYSMADATVLVSKKETFSMVTIESLCCGTPVCGYKAGAPETICLQPYCIFVEYGNAKELSASLKTIIYGGKYDKKIISKMAINKYSKEVMYMNYMQKYEELIRGGK